ncbi:MAG: DUF2721 domain-containing protein [Pseudodesulfovibrio sp.]|uniref:DUF2721 domain-containing protein n=1 Tax=Pseudodesulfovibrio aespoeensis (strain ATCC 700646 / DSM 10631 / Aspo-2) TaxID=643562 RepID=E6VSV3_PSEA9|nr:MULTISPECIES: DUF2721 domain-containing protein [Pseudodesulfovibrio]MBU4243261.1 DUF2721 domain-containing protein [Pseudomonadota bacterium]ADU63197.1 Protein of unknown function DUF2721 [Pseudodesulfovibrio aespoeensis Aspo-2]MBU4379146.1 DUF2721 domain-containing protein [Pseudomonadota bacterium]MBU4475094.1 DUF2721 domain-containing protein [Pseudomonadota bacterium]MBU4517154.1 DUF2721 domain-containing protein [Pseudomonadota bacterium]
METTYLVNILQASIAPFVLISGIGLLVLSMTNRIARPTDLIRRLLDELPNAPERDVKFLLSQVAVLRKRCSIMRWAIFYSIMAIICVSCVTLILFASQVLNMRLYFMVELLFGGALVSLITSLVFLLEDIRITLHSLDIEIERRKGNLG